jgi:hypothetical protein
MKTHTVTKIEFINFVDNEMQISINDVLYKFKLEKISMKLLNASEVERNFYVVSPSGYGIHWPMLDEDLSISALINNAS